VAKLKLQGGTLVLPFKTESRGAYPAMSGTYRPATPTEVTEYNAKLAAVSDPAERVRAKNAFYATHLKSWDVVCDDDVTPATLDGLNIGALPFPVWAQLDDVVLGYMGAVVPNSDGSSTS
jgi:hypothetical protein